METKEIYKKAKRIGMSLPCKERMYSDLSIKNLCQMYFDGDDWSMENDFPSLSILKEFIGKSEPFGIYTDFIGDIVNLEEVAFFGNSEVNLKYNGFSVGNIIARHNTKMNVSALGNSILFITILDEAEVNIECSEKATVTVFRKGRRDIKSIGNVSVK